MTDILTPACRNRPGIVAAVATHLYREGGNILEARQFDDTETDRARPTPISIVRKTVVSADRAA